MIGTATIALALLCILSDLTMITMFVVSGAPARPMAVIAIAASLTAGNFGGPNVDSASAGQDRR